MVNLIILAGIPTTGKSSFVEENLGAYVVIGFDTTLEKQFSHLETYDEKFTAWLELPYIKKTEFKQETIKSLKVAISLNKDIVIDETNLSNQRKMEWLKYFRERKYRKALGVFDCDRETALNRNEERSKHGKTIPIGVIDRMIKIQEPLSDEVRNSFDVVLEGL